MHRIATLTLTAAFAMALSSGALAQTPRPDQQPPRDASKPMSADTEFAQKAAMGGKHEVEGAKFAAGKASNAGVKAFANKLVKDHTAANNELMSMMKKKQIPMAADENAAPEPWRQQTGAAFDRAYIEHAITEHEKDIALFEAEAKDGGDAELKAWASKKLPTLREHLKTAQDLKAKLPTTN
jgi:putative membrane protein